MLAILAGCGGDGSTEDAAPEPEFVSGEVAVIPRPSQVWVDAAGSTVTVDGGTRVLVDAAAPALRPAAEMLRERLAIRWPGLPPVRAHHGPAGAAAILFAGGDAALGDAGYELEVAATGITLRAAGSRGARHGAQTLRQLLPAAWEAPGEAAPFALPSVRIVDQPRFAWRGFMLDVSRTFFPIEYLHRWLELMALLKLSVFHLHLTDDQGWRIESDRYPALHELGSRFDPVRFPDERGGYYTQAELRGLVAHAARLGIEIVPEIDLPGHSLALLHALPELACAIDGPRRREEFSIHPWAVGPRIHDEIVCACDEQVFAVLEAILDEVLEIFPSRVVHLGGDEVPKTEWEASARCQAVMRDEGLRDVEHLQARFTKRMEAFLAERGRTLIGWDEVLAAAAHGDARTDLAPATAIMRWRDFAPDAPGLYDRPVVQTPFSALYLDYYRFPLSRAYAYEPVPDNLTAAQRANVLGVQANMWTGYDAQRSEGRVDQYAFPKLAALAEVAWSDPARRDFADFLDRYPALEERLVALGVDTAPCDGCVP